MATMISSLWTVLWTIVNVLIFYWLLKKFLFKPVNKVMDERAAKIKSDISDAENAKKDANELKSKYEETVGGAKSEAKQIVQDAHVQAQAFRDKRKSETEAEVLKMKSDAQKEIEQERQKSLESAHDSIAGLAIDVASKLMQRDFSDEDNEKIVNEFLSEDGADK